MFAGYGERGVQAVGEGGEPPRVAGGVGWQGEGCADGGGLGEQALRVLEGR